MGCKRKEIMEITPLTEQEYLKLPLAEKQFYQPITQWLCLDTWMSLKAEAAQSFKQQFPNHKYQTIYILKDIN